jgi:hypothetical protein
LIFLRNDESTGFSHVATGNESWFSYRCESIHSYAKSREEVLPRAKTTIATKRAMVTIFFTETKLLVLDVLPNEEKFNRDPFLAAITPELLKENSNAKCEVTKKELMVHMTNSMCDDERQIQEYFGRKEMTRTPIQFIPQICHRVTSGSSVMPKSN